MRYAISYFSAANVNLQEEGVYDLMNETNEYNRDNEITGILLYNERNFFQLIEGEKQIIQNLYKKISIDQRHHDLIKILKKPVLKEPYDGYLTEFITDTKRYDEFKLNYYLHYIEVLQPESQKALKRVMELMMK